MVVIGCYRSLNSPRGLSELIYNMNIKIMTRITDLNYDGIHFLDIKMGT